MIFLQTQPQLSPLVEQLFSIGFLILLLVALYFAFKFFNKNHK